MAGRSPSKAATASSLHAAGVLGGGYKTRDLTDAPRPALPVGMGWAWIEQGFKITKRAGWQWQRTHMTQPARAARLWLAVAVATLWAAPVSAARPAETIPASTVPDVTALVPEPPRTRRATRLHGRSVSFARGWNLILVALLDHAPLPLGRFVPEPWPAVPVPGGAPHPCRSWRCPGRLRPQTAGATGTCAREKTWVS